MEENKQHENSAILVFDCHFLMKTLLENKTYCKYSGGSKTERVIIKSSIPLFQGWAHFGKCSQEKFFRVRRKFFRVRPSLLYLPFEIQTILSEFWMVGTILDAIMDFPHLKTNLQKTRTLNGLFSCPNYKSHLLPPI